MANQLRGRPARVRLIRCVFMATICLALTLSSVLAVLKAQSLKRAAVEGSQMDACEVIAAREHAAGMKSLGIGDRAGAAQHFREVNRWNARADGHMRTQRRIRDYWWCDIAF